MCTTDAAESLLPLLVLFPVAFTNVTLRVRFIFLVAIPSITFLNVSLDVEGFLVLRLGAVARD
jgi:hypothetical protein